MLGLLFALTGITILLIGLRGRRIDDHPLCSPCRFDLYGLTNPMHCPECGAALDHPRAMRIGHRRRLPWFIAIGGAATGLVAALLALSIWAFLSGTNVDAYKPAWMLKMQVKHGIFGSRDSAVLELVNRVQAGTLPNTTISWILVDGFGMRVEARNQICCGDSWPFAIDFKGNHIASVALLFSHDQIDIGPYGKPASNGYASSGGIGGRCSSSIHVGPIPPGTYDATLRFWFALAPRTGPAGLPNLGKVTLTFPRRLEVLPHYTSKPIHDDSIRAAMLEAVQLSSTFANKFSRPRLEVGIDVHDPPTNIAFEVFVKQGDVEWRAGSIMARTGARTTYALSQDMPNDFAADPEEMLIVLRPAANAAEATVDITEFWDGEIVLPVKDVKPNVPR